MEYTVNQLAHLSGVTKRTLRYYDEIGLLSPKRISGNGYRIYGKEQVDTLQQILFYRALDMSLEEIKKILSAPNFDREKALHDHLFSLQQKKEQIEKLIENVSKTIRTLKGESVMHDKEKFEGFKKSLIDENEKKYGKEVRQKYDDETVDASNAKLAGMAPEEWERQEALRVEINKTLKAAMELGDPAGELAQKACKLHRDWLCMFWKDGVYSKQAHRGLGEMYVADERFKAYYEEHAGAGAAEFLRDALNIYAAE